VREQQCVPPHTRLAGRTSLLPEEPSEVGALFSRRSITSGHEKKADLGVLEGADHDGRVPIPPISTVHVVSVKFEVLP